MDSQPLYLPVSVSNSNLASILIAEECLHLVEQQCREELTSSEAIIWLYKILPCDDQSKLALKKYINLCTEINAEYATTSVCGGAKSKHQLQLAGHVETQVECNSQKKVREATSEEFETQSISDCSTLFSHAKWGHSNSLDSDSSSQSRKHPKKSAFSWRQCCKECPFSDSSTVKILALKANHLLDIKVVKNNLIFQLDCPEFPDSLWADVLSNCFIDLNKVYASYYSLESNHKLTETIGNVNITLSAGGGAGKPSKSVKTHGEWAITFAAAKWAILYIYSHWAKELARYEEYIIGLFTVVWPATLHSWVLDLDKAIWVRIAKDNKLTLTSFAHFTDLSTQHLIILTNVPESSTSGHLHTQPAGQQPICRCFNVHRCTSDSCKYWHLCLSCSGKHTIKECGTQKKGEALKLWSH